MAIYHFNLKAMSRSSGKNAVASAAYRHATKMLSDKDGQVFDYRAKQDVIYTEVMIPDRTPAWLSELIEGKDADKDSERLWNLTETIENRKDSQVARDLEFSLPIELTKSQNIALAKSFVEDQFVLRGMVVDLAIHWDRGNPHAHVMLSMRSIEEGGFGKKVRTWNDKLLAIILRQKWSEYANYYLALHNHNVRIDHRSYKDQGIDLVPGIHQGKAVSDMERRGIKTEVKERADWTRRENLTRIAANPEIFLKKMTSHQETFTHHDVAHSLGNYINDQAKFSWIVVDGLSGELAAEPVLTPEIITKLIASIEHHDSVFNDQTLAKAIAPYTDNADMFAKAVMQIKASKELIYLGPGDDGRDRYTTQRMFAVENSIQDIADALKKQKHVAIRDDRVTALLAKYEQKTGKALKPEQLNAVKHILGSDSISCVVGRAGTGKSFSLGAAREVWQEIELTVYGVALSGIAADGLEKDAGFDSRTIASFLLSVKNGSISLHAKSVVVMDEAGMADSESLLGILKAVRAAKAKLVLVGDHGQLQPVGPGAAFRALIERIETKELVEVYRQRGWQREATNLMSSGLVTGALALYSDKACVHLVNDSTLAMNRLVADWFTTRDVSSESLSDLLVLAHANKDVDRLNDLIRESRVARNEIASGYVACAAKGDLLIAQGDRLLFTENNRQLGVKNGRFGTVAAVNFTELGKVIDFTVRLDGSEKIVTVDPTKYKHFALGYAATVHKVQGMTVNHAFVYASGMWNRCLTYVAMTRHRESCQVYAGRDAYRDEKVLSKNLSRFGLKDSLLRFPLAFAARRGIDTSFLEKLLPKHLSEQLRILKERIYDRYVQLTDFIAYKAYLTEKLKTEAAQELQAKQRMDARSVAAYADANQDVGVAWGLLKVKLLALGLERISYAEQDFEVIAGSEEYQAYSRAMAQRNELAHTLTNVIAVSPANHYQLALDSNHIDLVKLAAHAKTHASVLLTDRYVLLKTSGNVVLRDRLAAEIARDIKGHYGVLKARGLDMAALRLEAMAHVQRQLFTSMTPLERQAFTTVDRYSKQVAECGAYYAVHIKSDASSKTPSIIARTHAVKLEALSVERDRLAAKILRQPDVYGTALHFYGIGSVRAHFGEAIADKQQVQAADQLVKMEGYALRHRLRCDKQAIVKTTEPVAFDALLKKYVAMELQQITLMQMDHRRGLPDDDQRQKEASKNVVALGEEMTALALEAAKHPQIMAVIESNKVDRPEAILARGGYFAISQRFESEVYSPEDVKAVVKSLVNRVSTYQRKQRELKQAQDRGGRSQ